MGEQRWEDLFADLDAQMAMQNRLEADAETADRTRREQALVGWVDRVIGHRAQPLRLIQQILREFARDRAPVEVLDRRGGRSAGTIDVVHADALELARHDLTEARRAENVLGRVIIPFDAVSVVRRR